MTLNTDSRQYALDYDMFRLYLDEVNVSTSDGERETALRIAANRAENLGFPKGVTASKPEQLEEHLQEFFRGLPRPRGLRVVELEPGNRYYGQECNCCHDQAVAILETGLQTNMTSVTRLCLNCATILARDLEPIRKSYLEIQ